MSVPSWAMGVFYSLGDTRTLYYFGLECKVLGISKNFGLPHEACGILVPSPGINLASSAFEGRFLTTGSQGNPCKAVFEF